MADLKVGLLTHDWSSFRGDASYIAIKTAVANTKTTI